MIRTEKIKINDKDYNRVYSSAGRYVVRDKISYNEALDPVELKREYEEGNLIEHERDTMYEVTQKALNDIMGLLTPSVKKLIVLNDLIKDILDYYEVKYDD